MAANCPKCDKGFNRLNVETMTGSQPGGSREFRVVALCCPWCSAAIGASIDPIAIKTDTVKEVLKALRKTETQ